MSKIDKLLIKFSLSIKGRAMPWKSYLIPFYFFVYVNYILPAPEHYTYDLAVCAIFQNEGRFLREWIEFHKLVGVQHFYLYNNNSTDNYLVILQPYIDKGEIELFDWDYSNSCLNAQILAYNDALKKTKDKVRWVAFLDLDEYLYPVDKYSLIDFLKNYDDCGELSVNWLMFGTSGVDKIPDNGLMLEYLTKCNPKGDKHIKSIVRPERVSNFTNHNPHFAPCIQGFSQINPDKKIFSGPYSPYISLDKIRINHYWARDKDWLIHTKIPRATKVRTSFIMGGIATKFIRRRKTLKMSTDEWVFAINDRINVSDDTCILKYIPELRTALCS
jgi:hypothetical protein